VRRVALVTSVDLVRSVAWVRLVLCQCLRFFFGYCMCIEIILLVLRLCRNYICTEYTLNAPMYPLRRQRYKNYEF
jgi:hypothetical protein